MCRRSRAPFFSALLGTVTLVSGLSAQSSFIDHWQARVAQEQAEQPHWATPLIAPYPMLAQAFRVDVTRQLTAAHTTTINYGSGKGLNLMPGFRSQVDINYAPYLSNNTPAHPDGFGDFSFAYKRRIFSSVEKSYMVSAQIGASVPTGTHDNGAPGATLLPVVLAGKGFGRFALIGTLGGVLPVTDISRSTRSVIWNAYGEYIPTRFTTFILEVGNTYFNGGNNDDRIQTFLTPEISHRFYLHPGNPEDRRNFGLVCGMQFATSAFHATDHNLIVSGKFNF